MRAGDADAWRRLVELYSPLVYHWCRRSRLSDADAADLLQEVFGSVWTGIAAFRHDRESDTFRGWLWTIAQNRLKNFYAKQARQWKAAGGTSAQQQMLQAKWNSGEIFEPTALGGLFYRAIERVRIEFEPRSWQAFWLTTAEDRSIEETAKNLGITPNAVYKARSRILRRLREELGDDLT